MKKRMFLAVLGMSMMLCGCGQSDNIIVDANNPAIHSGSIGYEDDDRYIVNYSEQDDVIQNDNEYTLDNLKMVIANSPLKSSKHKHFNHMAIKRGDTYIYYNSNLRAVNFAIKGSDGEFTNYIVYPEESMPVYEYSKSSGDQVVLFSDSTLPTKAYGLEKQVWVLPISFVEYRGEWYAETYYQFESDSCKELMNTIYGECGEPYGVIGRRDSNDGHSGLPIGLIDGQDPESYIYSKYIYDTGVKYNGLLTFDSMDNRDHVLTFYSGSEVIEVPLHNEIRANGYSEHEVFFERTNDGYVIYDLSNLPNGEYAFSEESDGLLGMNSMIIKVMD